MDIEEIRAKVKKDEFVLSYHAHEERQAESIDVKDIKTAIVNGEITDKNVS